MNIVVFVSVIIRITLLWAGILGLFFLPSIAQAQAFDNDRDSVQTKILKIINTDILSFEKRDDEAYKKLVGNVHLLQDSTDFYCDSAYHFETENLLEAYGNVRVIMSDSIKLFSDTLIYDLDTRIAEVYQNITLTDSVVKLTTDQLIYYRDEAWGYYQNGGKLQDTVNILTSNDGSYYPRDKQAYFKGDVVLFNPDYTLETDTLGYHTETKIATFMAPTAITSEQGIIHTNAGTYDTENKLINLVSRASVADSSYTIYADSLTYNNAENMGVAKGNVIVEQQDSSLKVVGDYGVFDRARKESVITDNAVAIQLFGDDTLYMFADTLYSFEDSLGRRTFRAYYDVSFFMNEMQGKADSLVYEYSDSTIVLHADPIVWAGESQLTGDTIFLQLSNGKADSMWVGRDGFLVSQEDTVGYNQVKGKEIHANFSNNKLSRLHVIGNSESIYYSKNEAGEYEGLNQALSQEMIIYLKDNQAQKIIFLANPEGKFYPIYEVLFKEYRLDNMRWRIAERPLKPVLDDTGVPSPREPVFASQTLSTRPTLEELPTESGPQKK